MANKQLTKKILKNNPQLNPKAFQELIDSFTDENGEPIMKRKGYELDMTRKVRVIDLSDRPIDLSRYRQYR